MQFVQKNDVKCKFCSFWKLFILMNIITSVSSTADNKYVFGGDLNGILYIWNLKNIYVLFFLSFYFLAWTLEPPGGSPKKFQCLFLYLQI